MYNSINVDSTSCSKQIPKNHSRLPLTSNNSGYCSWLYNIRYGSLYFQNFLNQLRPFFSLKKSVSSFANKKLSNSKCVYWWASLSLKTQGSWAQIFSHILSCLLFSLCIFLFYAFLALNTTNPREFIFLFIISSIKLFVSGKESNLKSKWQAFQK